MPRRITIALLVCVALATAVHLDFHVARPTTHHLSLGLPWHWVLAAPVFALVAWYVAHAWPSQILWASVWIVGGAIVLGGVIEPAYEYLLGGAGFDWAFGPTRSTALRAFVLTGLIVYGTVLVLMRRRQVSEIS